MKTKLIILGCGNSMGTPRIDGYWGKCKKNNKKNIRTRCSAAIIKGNNSILIDTSPDIRNQLLNNNIKSVSSVLFTHEHADQTNGLFELRPFSFMRNKKKINWWKKSNPINVYGSYKTIKKLQERFDYCFTKISIYPPIVKPNVVKKKFYLGKNDYKILFNTFEAKHGDVNVTAYIFNKTAYISDCKDLSIINRHELKNLNYLIIDCLSDKENYAHFTLKECLHIYKALKPKKMILTNLHYDSDYGKLVKILPKNIIPAFDGMKINL